jgi:hypothetical protein
MKDNRENHWKDYYQILQVHRFAEPEVITAAYKKLLDKYHPDHNSGREQWANEKSKEINIAYDVLKDHIKRREYDEECRKRTTKSYDFSETHNKGDNEDFTARSPSFEQPITKIKHISTYWDNKLIAAHAIFGLLAIIILTVVIYGTWLFSLKSWLYAFLFFIIVGLPLIIWLVIRYIRWQKEYRSRQETLRTKETLKSKIDEYILNALEIMDTTHKWYNDENEANRELVDCLKMQGFDAQYQPRLANGSTADARVDDIIIEGKLSPNKADIDRLLGQLAEYTRLENKIIVVIYGRLDQYAQKRIENEIEQRYSQKVFLSYLDNPRRHRRN